MRPAMSDRALLTTENLLPVLPRCLVYFQPQIPVERGQMPVALPFVEGSQAPGQRRHQDE